MSSHAGQLRQSVEKKRFDLPLHPTRICAGLSLVCKPEFGSGAEEFDADAGFAFCTAAYVNHASCEFRLIDLVSEKETLAACHGIFEVERAAVFADVESLHFLVKGLLFRVRGVDKKGELVSAAATGAAVGCGASLACWIACCGSGWIAFGIVLARMHALGFRIVAHSGARFSVLGLL